MEYQAIDGWGIIHFLEWNWEGPERYPVLEQNILFQVKNDLHIDYVYPYHSNLYEEINDDDNPFHFNWDYYNSQFGKHTIVFERLKLLQDVAIKFAVMGGFHKPKWMTE